MSVDVPRVLQRLGIEAKRAGKEWVALCPNPEHADRKPSWRIRDDPGATKHGYHHCWPCGFKGSVVDLVMKLLVIEDWRDAKAWIEQEASVEQKEVVGIDVKVKAPRLGYQLPEEVRFDAIEDWPSLARDYVLKDRGLEAWQVERWGIGYAVEGRLRSRIVFVSRDASGRPRRYTARSFSGAEKRYLQPEPTERADENAMFGEQHWPRLNGDEDLDLVFVVEGEINALALEVELPGIYVAATSGSFLKPMQALKLACWRRACIMTDPDKAGDKLFEDIEVALRRHVKCSRLRLDEGSDQAKMRVDHPGRLGAVVRRWLTTRGNDR